MISVAMEAKPLAIKKYKMAADCNKSNRKENKSNLVVLTPIELLLFATKNAVMILTMLMLF